MKKTISAVLSAVAAILLITMARAADASQLVTYTSYTLPDSVFAKPVQDTPPVYNLYRRSTAADTVQARALGVPVYPVVIDREITPAAATDTLVVGTYENLYISSGAIVYVQGWVYTKKLCTIKPGAITLIEPNGILGLLEGGKVGAPGQDLVQVLGSMAADPGFGSKLPVIVCGIGLGGTSSVDEVVVAGFKRPGYFSLAGMGDWLENKSPG
ncbi:MAG: hypothetical protein Q8L21_00840, partial [Candidatus Komeilibacteria bacterium]|nr:hypothetical protein [Candidatus Komeilibacteria bacterium]